MNLTVDQRKNLIEIYPYLQPRSLWMGEIPTDYDYSYIRGEELPNGWLKLFLLYCKNIRPVLQKTNTLETFRFSDLKEKYGIMRLSNFGCTNEIWILTLLYEAYSKQICHVCGNQARYESNGWIEPWCETCITHCPDSYFKIYRKSQMRISTYNREKSCEEVTFYSFRKLSREYRDCMKMTDNEFYTYITTV